MTKPLAARQRDKLIEAAQNAITFAVEGKGAFPIDMLRYDCCWPRTEGDSVSLVSRDVNIRTIINLRGLKLPTNRRWDSFGWDVVEINGERM